MLGSLSVLLVGYFWLALLSPIVWQPIFPGAGFVVLAALAISVLMSAIAAWTSSRRWYFATAAAVGTVLFVGLRMH
jgi:hypothetical protein